ncbi:MAG: hypothetical protein Q8O88_05760, partial [bacterium]|nr:hypothetical protein [bacterium]
MIDNKNKGGRPWLTEEQKAQRKDCLLQKLEPYLKSGLSVNKALREARIHNSEFYNYMREDRLFGEKVRHFRDFISILVNNILFRELMSIVEKQIGNESKGIKPQTLS